MKYKTPQKIIFYDTNVQAISENSQFQSLLVLINCYESPSLLQVIVNSIDIAISTFLFGEVQTYWSIYMI